MKRAAPILLSLSLVPAIAIAQPTAPTAPAAPPAASSDKLDAKALMASGLKLYAAKDFLGALAVFEQAYARFPSAKILLNIATTLKQLARSAEAANAYQRYLDAHDTDPSKKPEVDKVLAELDARLGVIAITATPPTAEIQIDGGDWRPAAEAHHVRVPPGTAHLRARAPGHDPAEQTVETKAGATASITLALAATPAPVATADAHPQTSISTTGTPAAPPSPLGAIVLARVDVSHKGGAAIVGVTYEPVAHLSVEAGALIGPSSGAYAGARYTFLPGAFRPLVTAGMPLFIASGARVAIRGAAGLEYVISPHLSAVGELGVEHVFNPQMNVVATMFVPSVGVAGRL